MSRPFVRSGTCGGDRLHVIMNRECRDLDRVQRYNAIMQCTKDAGAMYSQAFSAIDERLLNAYKQATCVLSAITAEVIKLLLAS